MYVFTFHHTHVADNCHNICCTRFDILFCRIKNCFRRQCQSFQSKLIIVIMSWPSIRACLHIFRKWYFWLFQEWLQSKLVTVRWHYIASSLLWMYLTILGMLSSLYVNTRRVYATYIFVSTFSAKLGCINLAAEQTTHI